VKFQQFVVRINIISTVCYLSLVIDVDVLCFSIYSTPISLCCVVL